MARSGSLAIYVILVTILGVPLVPSASPRTAQSADQGSLSYTGWEWQNVNLQGFGWVTGMIIHPNTAIAPNLMYIRTDVGGAYRLDSLGTGGDFDSGANMTRWTPLLDAQSVDNSGTQHVESIALSYTNSDVVMIAVDSASRNSTGEVLLSQDRGNTWYSTGLVKHNVFISGNGEERQAGERLSIDPQANYTFFGSRKDGMWILYPAGVWEKVGGGLPTTTADPGFTFVLHDRYSGTVTDGSGRTKVVYAGLYQPGTKSDCGTVYRSTDGGTTWSDTVFPACTPYRAALGSDGTLYVTFQNNPSSKGSATGVAKYSSGEWQLVTPKDTVGQYTGVTVSPSNHLQIHVASSSFAVWVTANGGSSWTKRDVELERNVPWYWYRIIPNYDCCTTALLLDPNDENRLWAANGLGVLATKMAQKNVQSWYNVTQNLEELCVSDVKVPPLEGGAQLVIAALDTVGLRVQDKDTLPSEPILPEARWTVDGGTSVDYCMKDPNTIALVGFHYCINCKGVGGVSRDNGVTWRNFTSMPTATASGGNIAISATNCDNFVWQPTGEAKIYYTTDGGASWRYGSGLPSTAPFQRGNDYWTAQTVIADRVAASTFYYYANGPFYRSTDGGKSWSLVNKGGSSMPTWMLLTTLKASPVAESELYISYKVDHAYYTVAGYPLWRSKDGGVTWQTVSGIEIVDYFALGASRKGSIYPFAIYVHGRRTSSQEFDAIYVSEDNGETWEQISDPNQKQFCSISSMDADMREFGVVYVGTGGRGVFYGRFNSFSTQWIEL